EFVDIELWQRVVNKSIELETRARRARHRFRVKTELKMLLFAALSFGQSGFDLAARHSGAPVAGLPLFFCGLALFDRSKRGRLRRIRVAAHPLVVPTMEEFHVDIKLIENSRHRLIDNVIQCLRPMIKSRYRWKDYRAHSRQRRHCFQMT